MVRRYRVAAGVTEGQGAPIRSDLGNLLSGKRGSPRQQPSVDRRRSRTCLPAKRVGRARWRGDPYAVTAGYGGGRSSACWIEEPRG